LRGRPDYYYAMYERRVDSAYRGDDVDQFGSQINPIENTSYELIAYLVPSGKNLYVTEVCACLSTDVAGSRAVGIVFCNLNSLLKGSVVFGREFGGVFWSFSRPKKFTSGDTVRVTCHYEAGINITGSLAAHLGGWTE